MFPLHIWHIWVQYGSSILHRYATNFTLLSFSGSYSDFWHFPKLFNSITNEAYNLLSPSIPVVCARVILVGGYKLDGCFSEVLKGILLVSLIMQLIILHEFLQFPSLYHLFHTEIVNITESVVQVTYPEYNAANAIR